MTQLILKQPESDRVVEIIKDVINGRIALLEHSRQLYRKRLEKFEQKYNVTSEEFIKEWAAEDLEGKDMEYVEWAGEYKLFLRLDMDLKSLKNVEYVIE
ncbi:MAG TPA: hypothetical protein VK211_05380 [Kamptonema sp.]|nr:hypothetical protein [Kamptonema sp.]